MMTWPGGFQSFRHKQHCVITRNPYVVQSLHKADRILRGSLDNDLLSAKNLTMDHQHAHLFPHWMYLVWYLW